MGMIEEAFDHIMALEIALRDVLFPKANDDIDNIVSLATESGIKIEKI